MFQANLTQNLMQSEVSLESVLLALGAQMMKLKDVIALTSALAATGMSPVMSLAK